MDFNYLETHPPSSKGIGGGNWPYSFPSQVQCNFSSKIEPEYDRAGDLNVKILFGVYVKSIVAAFSVLLLLWICNFLVQKLRKRWNGDSQLVKEDDVENPNEVEKLSRQRSPTNSTSSHRGNRIQEWTRRVTFDQSCAGQTIIFLHFVLSMISFGIYVDDTIDFPKHLYVPYIYTLHNVDFFFNILFLVYFVFRIINNFGKFEVFCDPHNWTDLFVIPPYFVSRYYGIIHTNARFLRIFGLLSFAEFIRIRKMLHNYKSTRMVYLLCLSICIYVTFGGFIHLFENTGDPWRDYRNGRYISFLNSLYFILVTFSNVGYGEIYPTTALSKIALVIFINLMVCFVTTYLVEIYKLIGNSPSCKYGGEYKGRGLLLCGHITPSTLRLFLSNLKNRNETVDVVILQSEEPESELTELLEENRDRLHYFVGSSLDSIDLTRVSVDTALGCVIMADRKTSDPASEDSRNLVRALAIKGYNSELRILVQVLEPSSAEHVFDLPDFNVHYGDQAISVSNLQFGCLAQACLAPGFSTVLINLFVAEKLDNNPEITMNEEWTGEYINGANMNLYTELLSPSFSGLPFPQAAEILYSRFGVLLLALELKPKSKSKVDIRINPDHNTILEPQTVGFFIAQSADDVRKAANWNPDEKRTEIGSTINENSNAQATETKVQVQQLDTNKSEEYQLDSTGSFYMVSSRSLNDCVLDSDRLREANFQNHVVVCMLANADDIVAKLSCLIRTLRAPNIASHLLKQIVVIGNKNYLVREWAELEIFPLIWIVDRKPRSHANLLAVGVDRCAMCVVIGSGHNSLDKEPLLLDKEALLTTLKIHTLPSTDKSNQNLKTVEKKVWNRDALLVPTVTLFSQNESVEFMNFASPSAYDDFRLSDAFACGRALTSSAVDTLTATFYSNSRLQPLIMSLIDGSDSVRIALMDLSDFKYEGIGMGSKYGELVKVALRKHSRLCVGLYRRSDQITLPTPNNRYVITNPPSDLRLMSCDQVYVFFAIQR
ncbi:BK channel [Aphelenchoides besseyi]|nr:BK channel [Aphelenchoides besseyi]